MRIVFMGTPEFAVDSLDRLIESEHSVVAVVTNPDRPSGRGRTPRPSPVKLRAEERGIPLLQPESLKDEGFLEALKGYGPGLQVVVAFRMLPKAVRAIPPFGTINLHASLLPYYRGAAPIQRALMNGEQVTGLTTFFIDKGMDRGEWLLQSRIEVPKDMTAGELHDRMKGIGAELVLKTVDGIEQGELKGTPQEALPEEELPRAPKLEKEDRKLNWELPAKELHDHIRGMSPSPGVQAILHREDAPSLSLKILRSRIEEGTSEGSPGEVIGLDKDAIRVSTRGGFLSLIELQPSGKEKMSTAAFLQGYKVRVGDRFQ